MDPFICLLFIAVAVTLATPSDHHPPNIVIIVADDMGWNDAGHHGSEIPTPNIDALGHQGVFLNRHYSQSLCSPSRAALLTGRYPMRMGFYGKPLAAGIPNGLPLNETLLPQYLAQLGYSNHLVGKWHLGHSHTEYLPTSRGFDSHFGFWNGFIGHYDGVHENHIAGMVGFDMHRGRSGAWAESYGKHITQLLTEEAVGVIGKRSRGSGGLFLMVAHAAPHTGNIGQELLSPPVGLGARGSHIKHPGRRVYADMVKALDDSVGTIVEALAERDLLSNSIIVFISDNGAPSDQPWSKGNHGSNWPLRGEKICNYEGGVRTLGVAWCSLFQSPGRVYNNLMHISDWLPTFYAAAGGDPKKILGIDGISHWETLRKGEGIPPRRTMLVGMEELGAEALIMDNWKLIRGRRIIAGYPGAEFTFEDYSGESGRGLTEYNLTEVEISVVGRALGGNWSAEKWLGLRDEMLVERSCGGTQPGPGVPCRASHCLFDLDNDPCERHDLSQQTGMASTIEEMKSRLLAFRVQMMHKPPTVFDPRADPRLHGNYWTPWLTPSSINSGPSHLFSLNLILSPSILLFAFIFICLLCYISTGYTARHWDTCKYQEVQK